MSHASDLTVDKSLGYADQEHHHISEKSTVLQELRNHENLNDGSSSQVSERIVPRGTERESRFFSVSTVCGDDRMP